MGQGRGDGVDRAKEQKSFMTGRGSEKRCPEWESAKLAEVCIYRTVTSMLSLADDAGLAAAEACGKKRE